MDPPPVWEDGSYLGSGSIVAGVPADDAQMKIQRLESQLRRATVIIAEQQVVIADQQRRLDDRDV